MVAAGVPVAVITGTIGVGKTAVAEAMSEILHERGIRHGLIEVDWLGQVYPAPDPDDPYGISLAMTNLAAIWPSFLEAGITRAIVTMTIENQAELSRLREAIGAEPEVIRLEAGTAARRERITRRDQGSLRELFLAKTDPLARQMERLSIGTRVVANEGRSPDQTALEILETLAWL